MSNRYTAQQAVKLIREELDALTAEGVEWDVETLPNLVEWLDLTLSMVIDEEEEGAK